MGHVPAGQVSAARQGVDLPRREHRGARTGRTDLGVETLGARGERLAAWYLSRHRAKVLAANLQVGRGEVDLLVAWGGRPVVVEVKTARGRDPVGQFDDAKARQVRKLAGLLQIRRIDLVCVGLYDDAVTIHWVPDAA